MRVLVVFALLFALFAPRAAAADPLRPKGAAADAERFQVGAETHWSARSLDDRVGLGLGWRVPRRWYDADGALLTERSLLHPGHDLERPGLYVAVRF